MATMNVLDSAGATVAVEKPLTPGQATMANSRPVAIASDQSPVPVSGTITANAGTGTFAVSLASLPALATGGNVIGAVTQSGTWNVAVSNASIAITAASLPLPTGAALDATLTGGTQRTKLTDGTNNAAVKAASTAAAATDPALVVAISPNNTVAATQSGTWNIGSITTLPALVAGTALIGKVGIDQTTVGTTNAVSLAQIGANTILTGNGVTGTGSQRVTIASDNTAFSVNAVQSGTWNIATLTNLSQFGGAAINLGAGAVSTGTLRVTQASDSPLVAAIGTTTDTAAANGAAGTAMAYWRAVKDAATDVTTPSPISAPTITKGTQSANGLSVQELKDGGRSALCMTAQFSFAQTAETLLTMTLSADGAATTTFSSRVITSGKKFRIQSVSAIIESLGSGTSPQRAYLRLRRNTAGATTASSALQTVWGFVNSTAVVKSATIGDYEVPDGLEMNGDGTATFGFTLETPDWVTTTATGQIKITVIGFEF